MDKSQGKRLVGAVAIVMSSMILSRFTGFFRSTLIPNIIADPDQMDAFLVSFTITELMFNLLVGGAISAALIPIMSSYIAKKDEKNAWKAVGTFINVVFVLMIFICILGMIFSKQIIDLYMPEWGASKRAIAAQCTRIMFPSVAFMILSGITNGVLNSYQRFAAAAYGPTVYNIGSILSILFLGPISVDMASLGVMFSSALYFVFQASFALRHMKYYRFVIYIRHSGFRRLIKLAVPSLVSSSIFQVNIIISQFFLGLLNSGSIAAYKNANEVWMMPFGIFAVSIGTAVLPTMSEKIALGDTPSFKQIFQKGLNSILFLTIPCAIAFIILKVPIMSSIYKWSPNFKLWLIDSSGDALVFFSIALLSQSILIIVNRAYFAANDTKTPLYASISAVIINTLLCYILINNTSLDVSGMALAYSLASAANVGILIFILNSRIGGIGLARLGKFVLKVTAAAAVMGVVLFLLNRYVPVDYHKPFNIKDKVFELSYLGIEVLTGFIVYYTVSLLLRVEEAIYMLRVILRKALNIIVPYFKKQE